VTEPTTYSASQHFATTAPVIREIYSRVLQVAPRFGPEKEEAKKLSGWIREAYALAE
jgi:hypothetical protein